MNHLPICCVDILLFNEEKTKVLLGKRTNEPLKEVYFSTGGRLQKGEELKDCAVRKAKEELGVFISKERLLDGGVISEIYPNSSFGENIGYHAITIYFGCIVSENTPLVKEKPTRGLFYASVHKRLVNNELRQIEVACFVSKWGRQSLPTQALGPEPTTDT